MTHEFTVKQYAAREQVTPRTVWTWISKKAVPVRYTPGGGVRVLIFEAESKKPPRLKSNEV